MHIGNNIVKGLEFLPVQLKVLKNLKKITLPGKKRNYWKLHDRFDENVQVYFSERVTSGYNYWGYSHYENGKLDTVPSWPW